MQSPPFLLYRLSHFFFKYRMRIISRFISWTNRFLFAVWVPGSASIGKGTVLGYWGLGVVVHSRAKVGKNCVISQNVTIGRNIGDKEVPEIGNDVYIGPGSVIFGEIKIGNNVIIGANSVVNKSFPDNVVIAGVPAKIIKPVSSIDGKEI
jgi:serine O-acetyltransferase